MFCFVLSEQEDRCGSEHACKSVGVWLGVSVCTCAPATLGLCAWREKVSFGSGSVLQRLSGVGVFVGICTWVHKGGFVGTCGDCTPRSFCVFVCKVSGHLCVCVWGCCLCAKPVSGSLWELGISVCHHWCIYCALVCSQDTMGNMLTSPPHYHRPAAGSPQLRPFSPPLPTPPCFSGGGGAWQVNIKPELHPPGSGWRQRPG